MAGKSRAGIEMNFTFDRAKGPRPQTTPDTPFRLLVFGDFGGHQTRGEVRSRTGLRPRRVDLDSFPALFRTINPQVEIHLGDQPPFTLPIQALEDFHPDHLVTTLDLFAPMRELRRQLQDPKTFSQAAAMLGALDPVASATNAGTDLDVDMRRLFGRPSSDRQPPLPSNPPATIDGLIRQAVAPHVVGKTDPRQPELLATVDAMTGELMRAVLHDPGFQSVEAAWRGLDRMLRALELDETLQVFVLDISRQEWVEDFAHAPALAESAAYQLMGEHGEDKPWSLLVDLTPYRRAQEDAALLARFGTIAQEVQAAVLVGMNWAQGSTGFASVEDEHAWTDLRKLPAARSIAVTVPSILLRLPYGKDTDPTEHFTFTEHVVPPAIHRFLWGSSALAVAQLLGQSFLAAGGWDFSPGDDSSLDDLPIVTNKIQGESLQTPCAQTWLSEAKIQQLIQQGIMPMVSVQGRGEVRVPRFQSIALPPTSLAGRWRAD